MQKWVLVCDMGHEEWRKEVGAATKEEAVEMLLADPEVGQHVTQSHPEMANKSPEEMKEAVMGMVRPVDDGPAA